MRPIVEQLVADLYATEPYGVTLRVHPRNVQEKMSVQRELDTFVALFGFRALGSDWKEIHRTTALVLLQFLLQRDLVFDDKIRTARQAAQLAHRFLDLLHKPGRLFTNVYVPRAYRGEQKLTHMPFSDSITKATIDCGVVWIDKKELGILWIQAND